MLPWLDVLQQAQALHTVSRGESHTQLDKGKGSALKTTGVFIWNGVYSKVTTGVYYESLLWKAVVSGTESVVISPFPGLYNWADVKTAGDFFSVPVVVWWLLRHVVSAWRDSQCKLWASHQ